jgi:hypothetical protein
VCLKKIKKILIKNKRINRFYQSYLIMEIKRNKTNNKINNKMKMKKKKKIKR